MHDQSGGHAALSIGARIRPRLRNDRAIRATGLACVGSYGWGGAYGTTYLIDPESRLTILMMQQVVPQASDLRQKFATLVYQALLERPTDRCVGTAR